MCSCSPLVFSWINSYYIHSILPYHPKITALHALTTLPVSSLSCTPSLSFFHGFPLSILVVKSNPIQAMLLKQRSAQLAYLYHKTENCCFGVGGLKHPSLPTSTLIFSAFLLHKKTVMNTIYSLVSLF